MISKKKKTSIRKFKNKYGGNGRLPVYNESYKDAVDLYNHLDKQLNDIRDTLYLNNRNSDTSNNNILEAVEQSLTKQMDNIKITHPDAYKYITDLIILKYSEEKNKNTELRKKNRENSNWSRGTLSNFFAEYQDRKFANGYFYLNASAIRNKFSSLNSVSRVELISNIKKLDERAFHLLQLIIQKKDTRADYSELLTILDNNEVLYYMFE
jgi:hypothetical protein